MILGQLTGLRARLPEDVPVLHSELYEDVAVRSRADTRPWVPIAAAGGNSPCEPVDAGGDAAVFSVFDRASGELAGGALLWGIDTHNRNAHLGMSLRPGFRGRGFGAEVVQLLCSYGFTVRGLHRLQLETLADNAPMIGAARRAGFTLEGTLRGSAWVMGEFLDEVILGLPATEWKPADWQR
ncbi:GNAT family N-acetyltransferase [Streptomyces sp. NPDC059564]|uniref:GNAT family N-acetyltransferase n=1 Tax=Streptomyces sp. NPDC059564 TaxID=3346865 RepID=UPI0036904AB1